MRVNEFIKLIDLKDDEKIIIKNKNSYSLGATFKNIASQDIEPKLFLKSDIRKIISFNYDVEQKAYKIITKPCPYSLIIFYKDSTSHEENYFKDYKDFEESINEFINSLILNKKVCGKEINNIQSFKDGELTQDLILKDNALVNIVEKK